ncbi:MAG: hypothetical protein AB1916_14310 [Thermodesulfobacteriota bacterium]
MRRILALLLLAASLPLSVAPVRSGEVCRPGETPGACAGRLWRASSAAWRDLFEIPARGMEPYVVRRLSASPWEPVLAREVLDTVHGPAGLAAACGDGRILLWTADGVRAAQLPDNARPSRLAWAGGRYLAVLDASLRRVFVLNLDTGLFAAGAHDTGEAVSALSLSPGGLLSLADVAGRVWIGPALGPLRPVARMPEPAVALGLGRGQGVLAAADAGGRVALTALRPVRELDQTRVAGGPFASGRVQDDVLVLAAADGSSVALDLATRRPVAAPPAARPAGLGLAAANGALVYRSGPDSALSRVWRLETVVERRFPAVWRSALGRSLRVEDFDGAVRHYRLGSGLPMDPVQAGDWERLAVDPAGGFAAEGESYALGDVLYRDSERTLLARRAGDGPWYLWWVAGDGQVAVQARPGELPARVSLRADAPPDWVRMEPAP